LGYFPALIFPLVFLKSVVRTFTANLNLATTQN